MRRIVIWLASTVTVVVLPFGYHTSTNKTTSGTTEGGTSGSTMSAGNEPSASLGSPSSGSSGSPSTKITTYTGSVAQTRLGAVQVKISVQGGSYQGHDLDTQAAIQGTRRSTTTPCAEVRWLGCPLRSLSRDWPHPCSSPARLPAAIQGQNVAPLGIMGAWRSAPGRPRRSPCRGRSDWCRRGGYDCGSVGGASLRSSCRTCRPDRHAPSPPD